MCVCELQCVCVYTHVCVCERELVCACVREQTVGGIFTSGGCSFPTDSVTEPSAFICPGT